MQTFRKIYDLKGLKKRNLVAFLKVKLFVENLREGKKQHLKNKRHHDLETLKLINTKFGALLQTSLLLNCGNISRFSRKHWWI